MNMKSMRNNEENKNEEGEGDETKPEKKKDKFLLETKKFDFTYR